MPAPRNILLLIETSKAFGRKLLHGVGRYITESGCHWAVYVEERGKRERPPSWVERFDGDGVIAHSPSAKDVQTLRSLGVPMVETDMCGMDQGVPVVYSDERAIVELAVDHFLERNITRIAWCQLVKRPWCGFRLEALTQVLKSKNMTLEDSYIPKRQRPMEWFDQRRDMMGWLDSLEPGTGIFCANDLCGTRLLEAARIAEIAVPDRVAILGVDNDPVLCGLAWPQLSSIEQNAEHIGYRSAELIDKMLQGEQPEQLTTWVQPTGVETRRSSDVVVAQHPDVVAAVRYIHEEACAGIRVKDVAAHVAVSRSQLEKLFRRDLGRSPKAEIDRVRLTHAKDLLQQGNLTITSIARRCGFASSQYFSYVFSHRFGMSPGKWRREHGNAR